MKTVTAVANVDCLSFESDMHSKRPRSVWKSKSSWARRPSSIAESKIVTLAHVLTAFTSRTAMLNTVVPESTNWPAAKEPEVISDNKHKIQYMIT